MEKRQFPQTLKNLKEVSDFDPANPMLQLYENLMQMFRIKCKNCKTFS